MSMKTGDRSRFLDGLEIIRKLEEAGTKKPDDKLTRKYHITLQYKFGGKKRKASNSGKTGRAGRRIKRPGA